VEEAGDGGQQLPVSLTGNSVCNRLPDEEEWAMSFGSVEWWKRGSGGGAHQ
jgi:hypothetical protein